jgi:carboxymethylenebutenolidase
MNLRLIALGCFAAAGVFALSFALTSPKYQQMSTSFEANAEASACCITNARAEANVGGANQATVQFAGFGASAAFRAEHENPLPYSFEGKGTKVTVKSADGADCFGYEIKAAKPTNNVIFVIHEWWGLNDYVKQESERFADELGARVIAIDLYDGKVATTREDAAKYMQSCSPDRAKAIIAGFGKYVGADARIGAIGWCFGGGWSHQASLLLGKQAVACVIYYGMPETDASKLAQMNAPTLGIFAKQEKWISPEVVEKFEAAMKTAGKPLEVKSFDADHGFANPSNPKHNKEFTAEARTMVLAFFKKCFA